MIKIIKKTCKKCGIPKPLNDFRKCYKTGNPKTYYTNKCKKCLLDEYYINYNKKHPPIFCKSCGNKKLNHNQVINGLCARCMVTNCKEKKCTKCGKVRTIDEFYKINTKKKGIFYFQRRCKKCCYKDSKKRYKYNRDRCVAYYHTKLKNNPNYKIKRKKYEKLRVKKAVDALTDRYLKSLLYVPGINSNEIPKELIELQRAKLLLFRTIHNKHK